MVNQTKPVTVDCAVSKTEEALGSSFFSKKTGEVQHFFVVLIEKATFYFMVVFVITLVITFSRFSLHRFHVKVLSVVNVQET